MLRTRRKWPSPLAKSDPYLSYGALVGITVLIPELLELVKVVDVLFSRLELVELESKGMRTESNPMDQIGEQ